MDTTVQAYGQWRVRFLFILSVDEYLMQSCGSTQLIFVQIILTEKQLCDDFLDIREKKTAEKQHVFRQFNLLQMIYGERYIRF